MDLGSHLTPCLLRFSGFRRQPSPGCRGCHERLAQRSIPCITRLLPGGEGYAVDIGDSWQDFPTADVDADTRRMNAHISVVRYDA